MKVALLAPTPPPRGGIAGWTVRMMNARLKDNWKVIVVDEKTSRASAYSPVSSISAEIKRCFRIWNGLKKVLQDNEVKIVHSCIPATTTAMLREYVCACIAKRRHRKFIIHFRCTVPNMVKSFSGKFMLKSLCAKSDFILILNEQSSDFVKKFTKTPYRIIPNFIEECEVIENKIIKKELKTAIYVGGVIKEKGIMDLLQVARRITDVTFRCFGNVSLEAKKSLETLKLNNVIFEGEKPREIVRQALYEADIFVFLTYFPGEGFSNALCEAMAAGLPCIVSNWAANADMIEDKGGFVVPIHDVEATVASLENMRSHEIRQQQSRFNISKVKRCYMESNVLDQYVDVYESLLE